MLADAYLRSGKVRDLFMLNDGRLVLVASDRISAFDVILPTVVPDKGRVLTALSRFWFHQTAAIVPNHLLETSPEVLTSTFAAELRAVGHEIPDFGPLDDLRGRIMICRPARVVPIEAVVRGYLAGSGWKEYQATGAVCGVPLPKGLRESERLPEPIFTPATKAEAGEHDENVSFDGMVEHIRAHMLGTPGAARGLAEVIRDRALRLYASASGVAASRGIMLADTKFEFGLAETWPQEPGQGATYTYGDEPTDPGERLILIDEVLTPDSSRFWEAATYEPGRAQASFDKQYVRDWLETQPWDKTAPGPALPEDVVAGTRARYVEAYERITGASFARYLEE
ncbi:MAG: phosphoribosylaminoimidazolesuccinocarboxamide synthase, partial [Chloroflexota bacterium]